ncbi:MAG: hypothetical protein FJ279_13735 [Planctomycetes bacterium]|nr:hypothetical protein [Planctomycetota bacterium]
MPTTETKHHRDLFGVVAVRKGFCTEHDVARALKKQRDIVDRGGKWKLIGLVMLEMGILSSEQLIEILKYYEHNDKGKKPTTVSWADGVTQN